MKVKCKVYDTRYVKSGELERFLVISFKGKTLSSLNKKEKAIMKKIGVITR